MADIDESIFIKCGSIHPNHPGLKCIRQGGKCIIDDHLGHLEHRGRFGSYSAEIVQWGKDAEDRAARWGVNYRVIKTR